VSRLSARGVTFRSHSPLVSAISAESAQQSGRIILGVSPVPAIPKPLHPEHLTWTSLLGHWMDFAKTSVALPKDGNGPNWRVSVPAIISLQAVTFALADLDQLAADERALAIDRAELHITAARDDLLRVWVATSPPASLGELIDDAQLALEAAQRFHGPRSCATKAP